MTKEEEKIDVFKQSNFVNLCQPVYAAQLQTVHARCTFSYRQHVHSYELFARYVQGIANDVPSRKKYSEVGVPEFKC